MSKEFEWCDWQARSSDARPSIEHWLNETTADALVALEIPADSPEFIAILDQSTLRTELPSWLKRQKRFRETNRIEFPEHGCVVTIWMRAL
jgi:hypothetical protein